MLSENYLFPGTENVRGQICEHNFAPNGGYNCLFIIIVVVIVIVSIVNIIVIVINVVVVVIVIVIV